MGCWSGPHASRPGRSRRGGIDGTGCLSFTNDTIADNLAGGVAGASGYGGGIASTQGLFHFVSSTLAGNEAGGPLGEAGNLAEHEDGIFSFVNTIVSGGIAAAGAARTACSTRRPPSAASTSRTATPADSTRPAATWSTPTRNSGRWRATP